MLASVKGCQDGTCVESCNLEGLDEALNSYWEELCSSDSRESWPSPDEQLGEVSKSSLYRFLDVRILGVLALRLHVHPHCCDILVSEHRILQNAFMRENIGLELCSQCILALLNRHPNAPIL